MEDRKFRSMMSDEDKVLEIINRSDYALSQDDIYIEVSKILFATRQRLKDILERLVRQGRIEKRAYNKLFSENPRIYSLISEIYFIDEDQKKNYERDVLPKLERDTRNILR